MNEQDGPVVRPEELGDAGRACLAAALAMPVTAMPEAVRSTVVGEVGDVREVGVGGRADGQAGAAAAGLAERWEVAIALWSAALVAHGEALRAAAAAYEVGDEDAAASLGTS